VSSNENLRTRGAYLPVLLEIKGKLGGLEGKLDGFLASQEDLKKQAEDHSTRIRELETREARRMGFAAAISVVISALISFISKFGDRFL